MFTLESAEKRVLQSVLYLYTFHRLVASPLELGLEDQDLT